MNMFLLPCYSNGVGRTGVFVTLHIVLERLVVEGLADIFQTVKNLRIQRPAMVQSLVRQQKLVAWVYVCRDTVTYCTMFSAPLGSVQFLL